ncbi:type II secretion system F family protein [Patescibacteria group bacterium]|nr:type II secretion system F family protein [Patescibacteria group bacterium]MBU4511959.1 type II secretion system F family protein [Patescibacteria group bacterium]MCG2693363.1 type II secretion system F family protein [Candidatus Parcubacteria bacterium]
MIFHYQAKDNEGLLVNGTVEANNEKVAIESLREKGYTIVGLEPGEETPKTAGFLAVLNRVKRKEIVIFSRQLAVMAAATVPIVQALMILVKQTKNPVLKLIISEVADDVDGGSKLSSALGRHPKAFSNFYVSMVKTGETSGKLSEVLNYLADQEEKDYDLAAKIKGAMIYPIFIVSGLVLVGAAMMIFVIPQLTAILKESGADLPLSTRALIGSSDFFSAYWWIILIVLVAGAVGFKLLLKIAKLRYFFDWLKLRMPIFGKLFQKIYLVRFTRSMSTLVVGGVALPAALDIVSEVVGNRVYHDLVIETNREVRDGNPMVSVFAKSKAVPPMLSQMIGVGEQTGKLDEVLNRLGDFYAREVDNMVTNLVTLIEPLIMIFMGVGVGIMVAAILLPMYNLASSF